MASLGKSSKSSSDQNGVAFLWVESAGCAGLWSEAHSAWGSLPAPEGSYDYLYYLPFPFSVVSKNQSLKRSFIESEHLSDRDHEEQGTS